MKIVMVIGLPGAGKTTFAQRLAMALSAKHFNTDIIRDALGKRGQYDPETKSAIYNEMLRQTESTLAAGENVVVDGTFYQKALRAPYAELARQYAADIHWIEIRADEELVRKRVQQKRAYSEADFSVYLKIKAEYEPLEVPHLELWSDQLNLDAMVEQTLRHLNAQA